MKLEKIIWKMSLAFGISVFLTLSVFAQDTPTSNPAPQIKSTKKDSQDVKIETKAAIEAVPTPTPVSDELQPAQTTTPAPTVAAEDKEDKEVKDAILPYYTNYLSNYSLGPTDVISVEVFGHEKYSKAGITVPPTGTISYQLISGGIFVVGKTTDQVAKEIAKKLDEYIIDPQVTVTLERVGSAQYAVLGKVGQPGVRLMMRRYSVWEAIIEAGGLGGDADKKRIMLMRRTQQGSYTNTILKIDEMIAGKVPMEFLAPGDQIIVPEKKWSLTKILQYASMVTSFRGLMGSPF